MLPMLSLTNGGSALQLPFDIDDLDDAFGSFNVLAGGNLIAQSIGKYPMANQVVAANAVIREPLNIAVIMDAPMRGPNAWALKLAVFTSLKATLDQHNNAGGTYTVATPAFQYDNLVMLGLTDTSRATSTNMPQNAWRFDFEKPLVSLADVQANQNLLMSKITNGLPTSGNLSGVMPGSGAQTNQMPSAPTLAGAQQSSGAAIAVTPTTGSNPGFGVGSV
jgi:hypothetical protein